MSARIVAALILLTLTWLPYLIGYLRQTAARHFSGIIFNELDTNVYLAALREGQAGFNQFQMLFTPERGHSLFIYLFYIWSGRLLGWSGLSPLALFHILRSLMALAVFLALFSLVKTFVPNRTARWSAYWLVTLAGGLGWLLLLVIPTAEDGISPIEFWLMDGYTFFSLLLFPHFALVYLLLIGLVIALYRDFCSPNRAAWGVAWLCLNLMFIVNPKLLPLIAAIIICTLLLISLRTKRFPYQILQRLILLGLATLPVALLYGLTLWQSPVLRVLVAQDITISPPPRHYLFGWGLLWPLAVLGGWRMWHYSRRVPAQLLIVAWPLAALVAAYLPFQSNRRMVTALQLPLGVLAAIGLAGVLLPWVYRSRLAQRLAQHGYARIRLALFVRSGIVAACSISTLFLLLSFCLGALSPTSPIFMSTAEVKTQQWLAQDPLDTTTVLAALKTGNRVPARSGQRVVLGHWNLTLGFEQKEADVAAFFEAATQESERKDILRQYQVDIVHYGPQERLLGDFDPATAPYLTLAFQVDDVALYTVNSMVLP